jgi:NADH:ubiquinone oxidoreductase subunit 6 (subunit J)
MYFLIDLITFLFYVPIGVVEGCMQVLWFSVYLIMFFFSLFLITVEDSIYCVLFLIGIFLGAAFLLLILKTEFLAFMFLIVYVGAIAVFFLFIVMMINFKLQVKLNTGEVLAGFVFLSIFFLISVYLLPINHNETFIFSEKLLQEVDSYFTWFQKRDGYQTPVRLNEAIHYAYLNDLLVNENLLRPRPNKLDFLFPRDLNSLNCFCLNSKIDVIKSLNVDITKALDYFPNLNLVKKTKAVIFFFDSFNSLHLVEDFRIYAATDIEDLITPYNFTNIRQIGLFLYTYDLIAFLLCGFVLLVAILGCVILTVEVKLVGYKKQNLTDQLLKRYIQVGYFFSNN